MPYTRPPQRPLPPRPPALALPAPTQAPAQSYNEDAEMCIIGSLMIDPDEVAPIVFADLKYTDLYIGKYRAIFEVIRDMYIRGVAIDEITVSACLEKEKKLEYVGGADAVGNIIVKTPSAAGIEGYIGIVKEHSQTRRFVECIETAKTAAANADMPLALRTVQELVKVQESESIFGFHTVRQLMQMYGGRHAEPIIGGEGSAHGVLRRKEIMVVAAPSKAKKSWWLMGFAWDIVCGNNLMGNPNWPCAQGDVWYLDNELLPEEGTLRLNGMMTAMGVPDEVQDRLHVKYLRGMDCNINNIEALIRGIAHTNPAVIILDAIYKFYPEEFDENSNSDWTQLGNKLIRYASMANCAIIFAHHFAKGKGADKAFLDRAAGAGALVRTVDVYCSFSEHELSDDGIPTAENSQPNGQMQVLEFAFRSWREQAPLTIRWDKEQTRWVGDMETAPMMKGAEAVPIKPKAVEMESMDVAVLDTLGNDQDVKHGVMVTRIKEKYNCSKKVAQDTLDAFVSTHGLARLRSADGDLVVSNGNVKVYRDGNTYRYSRVVRSRASE